MDLKKINHHLIPFWIFSALLFSCSSKKNLGHAKPHPLPKYEWQENDSNKPDIRTKGEKKEVVIRHHDDRSGSESRNRELEAYLENWIGTPHKMGGKTKKGTDCSGFVGVVYTEFYNSPFQGRSSADLYQEVDPIEKHDLKLGDLVFFKVRGKQIDHVGIYLSDGEFIHASSSKGVMVSRLDEAYWTRTYFRGGRKRKP